MRKLLIIFLLAAFISKTRAQTDTIYYEMHDTMYYQWYHNHLSVGLFQSTRDYELTFNQNFYPERRNVTELKYRAEARAITGVSLDFDKLAINIGFKTKEGDVSKKGKTSVKNFAVTIGRTKFFYNLSYREYKGFYDLNTANYDSSYTADQPFYQNPGLRNRTYKFKATYFPGWKRFSIKSTVAAGFRQLKSTGSFVFQTVIYHNLIAADTSIIPHFVRPLYDDYAYINYLRTFALAGGGGGSYNLVILKRVFVNATAIINSEAQWRKYGFYDHGGFEAAYIKFAFEGRLALGYNNERFFVSLNGINEFAFLTNTGFEAESIYTNFTFNFSYRFKIKRNSITSYIKDNKIYRKL